MVFYCYILKNDINNKTYNGYTISLKKRLRQHNGDICGGAKFTRNSRPWHFYVVITGFETKSETLSCEFRIKNPTFAKKRQAIYCGISGRIKSLNIILNLDKWTSKSTGLENGNKYTLYISDEYKNLIDVDNIKPNVEILNINELLL